MQPRGECQTLVDTCAAVATAGGGGSGGGGVAGGSGGVFVAFTKGLPNRFLAPKSVPAFLAARAAEEQATPGEAALAARADAAGAPLAPTAPPAPSGSGKWLVGEVSAIEGPLVASSGSASDHLNLSPGTQYWLLTAEPVGVAQPAPAPPLPSPSLLA